MPVHYYASSLFFDATIDIPFFMQLIARDPIGVMPLYTGHDEQGRFYVASEMKALVGVCKTIREFPPGHYLDSEVGEVLPYYKPSWVEYDTVAVELPSLPPTALTVVP